MPVQANVGISIATLEDQAGRPQAETDRDSRDAEFAAALASVLITPPAPPLAPNSGTATQPGAPPRGLPAAAATPANNVVSERSWESLAGQSFNANLNSIPSTVTNDVFAYLAEQGGLSQSSAAVITVDHVAIESPSPSASAGSPGVAVTPAPVVEFAGLLEAAIVAGPWYAPTLDSSKASKVPTTGQVASGSPESAPTLPTISAAIAAASTGTAAVTPVSTSQADTSTATVAQNTPRPTVESLPGAAGVAPAKSVIVAGPASSSSTVASYSLNVVSRGPAMATAVVEGDSTRLDPRATLLVKDLPQPAPPGIHGAGTHGAQAPVELSGGSGTAAVTHPPTVQPVAATSETAVARSVTLKIDLTGGQSAQATVRERQGAVEVKVVADSQPAAQGIRAEVDGLRNTLGAVGIRLTQAEVSYRGGGDRGQQEPPAPPAQRQTIKHGIFTLNEVNE